MTAEGVIQRYVERWGLLFEASQLPPAAGRIWGWLLLAPGGATSRELCDGVGITKGAVSTNARLLEQAGLVERVREAGSRAYRYRVRPDAGTTLMERKLEATLEWRAMAEEGVELARKVGRNDALAAELAELYRFLEEEQIRIMERWAERKSGR